MTIAETLVKAHADKVFTRHFAYVEALYLGTPYNIDREIKSFLFDDGSIIEFGPVVIARPF